MAALLIPGLAFLSALVLVALANTANVQTKAQTESQQTFWGFIGDALTGKTVVHQITQATRAAVSRWALAQLKPVTAWFVAFNALLLNVFRTQADVAEETATAVERIRTHTIPVAVGKGVRPVDRRARNAGAKAAGAAGAAAATHKALGKFTTHQHGLNTHYTTAIDHTFPGQLGRIKTRADKLSRDQAKLRERTTSLEDGAVRTFEWIRTHPLSAVTGVFAGAVAVALARLGFGFFRCRSWRNLGRRMTCGMATLLDDLLFAAIEGFAVIDICDFANAAQTLAQTFQPTLMALVDVENALVGCHGATAIPELSLPALHLPPTNLGLKLAG